MAAFDDDQRAVSELVGTVFVISITLTSAMITVALAGAAMQAIGDETQDSLTSDSFHEMDNRLKGLVDSRSDATTTFTFPAGSGASVEPLPTEGNVTISASTANPDHESHVLAPTDTNSTKFTIGTITYEDRRGNTLVYQGGGLWEYRADDFAVMQSRPPFDHDGRRIDFQFVNVSELRAVQEGEEIVASQDIGASRARSNEIRDELSAQWTIEEGSGYTVPVDVNVTIESEYAIGWRQYAQESMRAPPDEIDYNGNDAHPDLKPNVTFTFRDIGGSDLPEYPGPILYAGGAARAPNLFDPFGNSTIRSTGDNQFEIENDAGGNSRSQQQLAYFNETEEEWMIHWRNNGGQPPTGGGGSNTEWYNVSETEGGFSNAAWGSAEAPPEIDFYDSSSDSHEYGFADDHADTKVCIVSYETEDIDDDADGVVDHLEQCASNLDVTDPGRYMPADLEANITTNVTDPVVGEPEPVQVNVSNVGAVESTTGHDVGLYRELDGELTLVDYNTSDAIGTIPVGVNKTLNMTWTPRNDSTAEIHAIVGHHDADSQNVSVQGRDINLTVDVTDETSHTVPLGQELEVNATINNTGNAGVEDTNVVLREADGTPVDRTQVTLDPGEDTNVSLYWDAPVDEFTEELEVEALNGNETHVVTDAGRPNFDVDIDAVGDPARSGEPLNVTATITNTGSAPGTQDVVMIANTEQVDDLIADSVEVGELDVGNSTTVELSWSSPVNPERGDNEIVVRSQDTEDTAQFDVAPRFEVEIQDVSDESIDDAMLPLDVDVEAEVTNVGDVTGTQDITLGVPTASDLELSSPETDGLTIAGGSSDTVTLEGTVDADSLTGNLSVSSEDDTDRHRIIIERDGPDCATVLPLDGNGSPGSPYEISTVDELQCLDQHVEDGTDHNSEYVITEDIDAYGTQHWNGGDGFEPIAEQARYGNHFRGDLDGQGHTIEGLTIDRPDEAFVGIFAVTHDFGGGGVGVGVTIENTELEDIDVHGKTVVGGLVGGAGGSIERVSVSGDVESEYQQVGGIVGHGHDADLNNELVSTANVTGTYPAGVDGAHPWEDTNLGIGGIIGGTGFETDVATAYSRATVTGNSGVGGITGWTSDYASTNEQMYWVGGNVERTGPWRLDEIGRDNLTYPDSPTAGGIAGRMEVDGDTFKDSVYSDEAYEEIGEQEADADAITLPASEMVGPQVLPDSEADEHPGITTADTDGTMTNLDWDIWAPVYEINETGAIVNQGPPIFQWQVEGSFVVDEIDAPQNVTEGDALVVNATIVNTKDEADTQDVRLFSPEGNPVAVNETSLAAGEEATVTLEWDTRVGDNTSSLSDPALTVRTDDSGNTKDFEVLVQQPPVFEISDVEGEDGIEDDQINVSATIDNVAGPGEQTVFLEHESGNVLDSTTVALDNGSSQDLNLTWYTQIGDAGDDQELTIKTLDDDGSVDVEVDEAPTADFDVTEVNFTGFEDSETPVVAAGETLSANVTVENDGGAGATKLVWMTPASSSQIFDHNETQLDPGAEVSFNLTWDTASPGIEELEINIEGEDPITEPIVVQGSHGRAAADPIDVDLSQISIG